MNIKKNYVYSIQYSTIPIFRTPVKPDYALTYAKTIEMLTVAFGKSTVSRTQVQLWYNRFKEDRDDVNDDARPGSPCSSTTDENIEAGKENGFG